VYRKETVAPPIYVEDVEREAGGGVVYLDELY